MAPRQVAVKQEFGSKVAGGCSPDFFAFREKPQGVYTPTRVTVHFSTKPHPYFT